MQILQVRFKNLNSLAGEWEIDFTHPSFTADGIFAITGPTGAGKSTILDAVCLALYGRTPRLNKVTKSGNEIMSRQTGECYAEVTFETQTGRYRCHWSQRRAHKKPDGELQSPKHEMADDDSGRIFEAKIRGVAEQIEAVTGMDFDQFTRSMLLAQGGFAAFLQAAPDERAPILEQITGTEIYSKISIRVHERRSDERKELDMLQAKLTGMQLLSEDEELQLNTGLEQKIRRDEELNERISMKNRAIAWLGGIIQLEAEIGVLQLQKQAWQFRQEAFAPEQERLGRAVQALELAGEYAGLISIRREQESDRRNHRECLEVFSAGKEDVKQAEEAMKEAAGQLDAGKAAQREALPVIRKVLELDLKIQAKDAPVKAAKDAIFEHESSLNMLCSGQNKDCADLRHKQKDFEELLKQLDETKADEGLVEHLTGIGGKLKALKNLHRQHNDKIEEIDVAKVRVARAEQLCKEEAGNLEKQKRAFFLSRDALVQRQKEFRHILKGRELSDWHNSVSSLTTQSALIDKGNEAVQILVESGEALDKLGKGREALNNKKSLIEKQLQKLIEKKALQERELGLLEGELSLLKKIEDFEEARRQLQDGRPCPLCGAKEHPFAEGNIPIPDKMEQQLGTARADLKRTNEAIAELMVEQAEVKKDIEQASANQKEHFKRLSEAKVLIDQICSGLSLDIAGMDPGEKLKQLRIENEKEMKHAGGVVQGAEGMEKEINGLREARDKAKEEVTKAEHKKQAALHGMDSAGQLLEQLEKEAKRLLSQQEEFAAILQQDILDYGMQLGSLNNLGYIQEQLTVRRNQWILRQQQKSELDRKIAALQIKTRHQAETILRTEAEMKKQRELLDDLLRKQEDLRRERYKVFGDRRPEDEEERLSGSIEFAEKRLEATRREFEAKTRAFGELKSKIEELEKAIGKRDAKLKPAEEAFLKRLKELGFIGEEDFTAASLPEAERNALAQKARKLADEKTELTSKERDKIEMLERERQKRITDQSQEELDQALTKMIAVQKELQQDIGGIRQKLKDNEVLKEEQQDRLKDINMQQRECSRWDLLHEIIGSADGKKYRNFAQGLTLEIVIGYANRQLQKMTDRYLLIRDETQPLELNVIDNYQAGEIRSTKNLSGGESFIVSLSLALGLSHMAGENVRVDSLFLDEGFGMLDEEALDTALETLAGLQQEGKLIGMISHVPALKERIGTRIQVTPQTGGRSRISGPGCRECRVN
ncbi:MAG: AAA family ATPase [bacterium]|nr:AAA family ATPase [bacterium]